MQRAVAGGRQVNKFKRCPGGEDFSKWYRLRLPPRRQELWVARSNPTRVKGWKLFRKKLMIKSPYHAIINVFQVAAIFSNVNTKYFGFFVLNT
jgi:hypothetical protein